jgi:hypothetical protein
MNVDKIMSIRVSRNNDDRNTRMKFNDTIVKVVENLFIWEVKSIQKEKLTQTSIDPKIQ